MRRIPSLYTSDRIADALLESAAGTIEVPGRTSDGQPGMLKVGGEPGEPTRQRIGGKGRDYRLSCGRSARLTGNRRSPTSAGAATRSRDRDQVLRLTRRLVFDWLRS